MIYRVGAFFFACIVLAGCGGSTGPVRVDYDTARNRTVYQTRSALIPIDISGGSFGSQMKRVRMNLWANCRGRACHPGEVRFTLSTTGDSELHIGERSLLIVADGERFFWEDPEYEGRNQAERIAGVILQVSMGVDRLEKIAYAEELEGAVGTADLELTRGQERLRAFAAEVTGESDQS